MADTFNVGASSPVFYPASPDAPARVTNENGDTTYYKSTSAVSSSSNDGSLAAGASKTFRAPVYLITSGAGTGSYVIANRFPQSSVPSQVFNTRHTNMPLIAGSVGTDTSPVAGTVFITSLQIPYTTTVTGLSYLIGGTGTGDKTIAALYDQDGNVLANSALAGTTVGTANTVQSLDFTAPFVAYGPSTYYASISSNGTTATIRTITLAQNILSTSATGAFGTLAAITPPTSFTASKAPVVSTY